LAAQLVFTPAALAGRKHLQQSGNIVSETVPVGLKRKFLLFCEESLRKVTKITKIFAKTKMYEKTDAGNRKYWEIS
jgi:hypothetical protein